MNDPKDIMRQYMEAILRRDFDAIRQLLHPQYSYTSGDGQRQEGPEAGVAIAKMYTAAFPDQEVEIKHMHAAGDVVVTEFIGRGTHKGELMGLAPTGRTVEIRVCNIAEMRDGKVHAEREYFDTSHLMRQLGVVEAAPA
jgi:steroid delta-isomerase-like uncharacterized protein